MSLRSYGSYDPDDAAIPDDTSRTALLSQRDLGLNVPINYITAPGISIQTSCFPNRVYNPGNATKCFSNLLAAGFRRFLLDVYWDEKRRSWSLCPAQIPQGANATAATTLAQVTATTPAEFTSVRITVRDEESATFRIFDKALLGQRQATASSSTTTSISAPSSSSAIATSVAAGGSNSTALNATASATAEPAASSGALLQIGPYQCSSTLDMLYFLGTLAEFLRQTSNTVDANLIYLSLNVHAAAPSDDPNGQARPPEDSLMPLPNQLLSNILDTNLSSYLYTPQQLSDDRANLNRTWYRLYYVAQPISYYYTTESDSNGVYSTPNGWPSESYVEFDKAERLLAVYGTIDNQMAHYNFTGDNQTIFLSETITEVTNVSFTANGTVTQGCFLDQSSLDISQSNNNSWAEYVLQPQQVASSGTITENTTYPALSNLTTCGISPILNKTISNSTAANNVYAYADIPISSVWSWAVGEPANFSTNPDSESLRCAVMDLHRQGRWRIADCNDHHHYACRVGNTPYDWSISDSPGSYATSAEAGCGNNQTFSVPKTGLENLYLMNAWRAQISDLDDQELWLDFNSLDQQGCWVIGANTSCPYTDTSDDQKARTVIIPTVAAVIIFVLAALTLFVKCAANRQSSKRVRRRKGDDGWDYEGVPS